MAISSAIARSAGDPTGFTCPACSGVMQWKQNRTSLTWFMGCKRWPTCSGTRDENGVDTRVSPQRQNRFIAIIKACILRADDECLTFSHTELERAEKYDLHLDEISEEKSYILTLKEKQ